MKFNISATFLSVILLFGATSCSEELGREDEPNDGRMKMNFKLSHPSATRATETAFENGDKVGVFVNEASKILEIGGNTVNNEAVTFNGGQWQSTRQLYWDAGTYNATAYYPYIEDVSSISDLPFEVKLDQSTPATANELSGYEASDFLYASAKGIEASPSPVGLQFKHILSKLTIRLVKGQDFEGDIPENATVYIHNTIPSATIDLSAGVATKDRRGTAKSITARQTDATTYTAIMIPQRLDNRVPLIEVIMNGVSYLYESKFIFKPGIHHLVNLVVDRNPEQVKIEIGGEIENWNQ